MQTSRRSAGRSVTRTGRASCSPCSAGEELPAGELAARAGTSSSLTSAHLARLLESGLVTARAQGRQRYYKIASAQIAESIEALLAIAPHQARWA